MVPRKTLAKAIWYPEKQGHNIVWSEVTIKEIWWFQTMILNWHHWRVCACVCTGEIFVGEPFPSLLQSQWDPHPKNAVNITSKTSTCGNVIWSPRPNSFGTVEGKSSPPCVLEHQQKCLPARTSWCDCKFSATSCLLPLWEQLMGNERLWSLLVP